jgi:hypothetical protein
MYLARLLFFLLIPAILTGCAVPSFGGTALAWGVAIIAVFAALLGCKFGSCKSKTRVKEKLGLMSSEVADGRLLLHEGARNTKKVTHSGA